MKKELIGMDNLEHFICLQEAKIYADPAGYILSPGAKDELAKRHIEVVYGPCPNYPHSCHHDASASGVQHGSAVDDFTISVAAVLRQHYGITDPEQLKALTLETVKTIKASLS